MSKRRLPTIDELYLVSNAIHTVVGVVDDMVDGKTPITRESVDSMIALYKSAETSGQRAIQAIEARLNADKYDSPESEPSESQRFYVCDIRPGFSRNPYITFWRPNSSGYAYPLAWSGKYTLAELQPGYHELREGKQVIRFPVPCEVADKLGTLSASGMIDGGPTLVVENTPANRRFLRSNRFDMTNSQNCIER